ncbi:MAG TPA: DUF1552 domain-containing protein [Pirellulales bacterium]|jgi:hypothetical protein|nr:DUF1552 domain-containing protein [Pirellulales bacterium]
MTLDRQAARRKFLRGMGVCIALPALDWLAPRHAALAAGTGPKATTATGAPLRMAFCYIPNGVNVACWTPNGEGAKYELNRTMEPLADFRSDFQVITGLEQRNGFGGKDGAGDHARANATILTGARPRKTAGADIQLGVSVDQLAAQHVGDATRFPSLELSCDGVRKSGACDSGYSCAYQFNLSWRTPTSPMAPESNPRLVFERLFGAGSSGQRSEAFRQRQQQQRSILDFAADEAERLHRQLGRNDQHKLDEYLTGVRDIERRIERAERFGDVADPGVETPSGIPGNYRQHLRLMSDMLVLAFQTDSTRIATFLMAHDGSNRTFEDIGIRDGHHSLSHHMNDKAKLEKIAKIDAFYTGELAYFLGRLRNTKDRDGRTLLENSMIVYASGLSDGNRHQHNNLPVILAGHGGGLLHASRHLKLTQPTPMTNLYVSMLDALKVPVEQFGDSNGRLEI